MTRTNRFWEIDTLRGIAIVLMVYFHFVWDLSFFGLSQVNILGGPWQAFARSIATLFIFTMGVSLTLSYNRESQRTPQANLFKKFLLRGGKIFGWGMVITIATYFFIGSNFVIFGILHVIGFTIVLGYPFLRLNKWITLTAGLVIIGLGIYIDPIVSESPWLIWLGIKQTGRSMVDYYPAAPWSGVALVGIFVGHALYPQGKPDFTLPDLSEIIFIRWLRFLGRHSLLVYLTHQPVLIGIFFIILSFPFGR